MNLQYTAWFLVQEYLGRRGHVRAFLELEKDTRQQFDEVPEVAFLRKLVFQGDYTHLKEYLDLFAKRMPEPRAKRLLLTMQRQRLFQLIEDPDHQQLIDLFQGPDGFAELCGPAQAQELYSYLTLNSINDDKEYEGWSVQRGRLQCFQQLRKQLEQARLMPGRGRQFLRLEQLLSKLMQGSGTGGQFQRLQPSIIKEQQYVNGESQFVSVEDKVNMNLSQLEDDGALAEPFLLRSPIMDALDSPARHLRARTKLTQLAQIRDPRGIRSAHLSQGRLLALGCNSGILQIYQLNTHRRELNKLVERSAHKGGVIGLSWHNDKQLLSCSSDGRVCLSVLKREDDSLQVVELASLKSHLRGLQLGGDEVFVYGNTSCIWVWSLGTEGAQAESISSFESGEPGGVNHLKSTGRSLLLACESMAVAVFDLRTRRRQHLRRLGDQPLWVEGWGGQVFAACEGGAVVRLSSSLQELGCYRLEKAIRSLQISKEGVGLGCTFGNEVAVVRLQEGVEAEFRGWNSGQACSVGWQGAKMAWVCWADGCCKIFTKE